MTMKSVVGFEGEIPDGTPRKIMNSSRIYTLGSRAATPLEQGLRVTYNAATRRGVFAEPSLHKTEVGA
jgi:GDP-L-fucose synthase